MAAVFQTLVPALSVKNVQAETNSGGKRRKRRRRKGGRGGGQTRTGNSVSRG